MKRFILIAAALVAAASSAKADETSESILRHIAETFASYGNYEVRFTVSAQGMGNMSGNYFVSGDRYRIKLQKQEQFSDAPTVTKSMRPTRRWSSTQPTPVRTTS